MNLKPIESVFLTLTASLAVCLILISTSKYGIGVSPDSSCYISIAENLTKGNGFAIYDLEPAVAWPPLYPAILAFAQFFGLNFSMWARLLNALLYGLLVLAAARWLFQNIKSRTIAWIGTSGVLFSPVLLFIAKFAWSELLFSLLVFLALVKIKRLQDSVTIQKVLILALLTALACLTRYVGVTLVIFALYW
ncbi:MAG: hypothetical protein ACREBV_08280, partial [Candidatus Zixiibacteriota bacterium]